MNEFIISVASRLPFTISRKGDAFSVQRGDGGLISATCELKNILHVGIVILKDSKEEMEALKVEYLKLKCLPIFISESDYSKYYTEMSNSILWPLLHYEVPDSSLWPDFQQSYDIYHLVNKTIAKEVSNEIKSLSKGEFRKYFESEEGIEIKFLVHDYHLFVLPFYLRKDLPSSKIAFFLHTPFPAWDFFKLLPKKNSLLMFILSSDVIGFHTKEYLSNFVDALIKAKLLSDNPIAKENNQDLKKFDIDFDTRRVGLIISPVRINLKKFFPGSSKNDSFSPEFNPDDEKGKTIFKAFKLRTILGVDRSDTVKGIYQKLEIFQKLFEIYPELRGSVQLLQILVPSRQNVLSVKEMEAKVFEKASLINAEFGSTDYMPINIIKQSVNFDELQYLYNKSSVLLVSSLRDGLNLVCLEYLASQHLEDPGVALVSKFCGIYDLIKDGILKINPWNYEKSARTLYKALNMEKEERKKLMNIVRNYISSGDPNEWFLNILKFLS